MEVNFWERASFWLLFLYFIGKTLYLALNIRRGVFPDETSWFGMAQVFSRALWLPVDSPESYPLGLVTHIPNLYFLLMGKLLTLNLFGVDDLIFLRLANVCLGGLTILFAWRLICMLIPGTPGRLLALVMFTNTMMFTFMFGAVNYDNLSSLLAVLALYFFVVWRRHRQVGDFLWFAMFVLAGTLTKNVFLPFAVGLLIVLLGLERNNILAFFRSPSLGPGAMGRSDWFKLLVVLLLLGANVNLYLGNKLRYGQILPNMDQVLSIDDCLQNRLYTRGYVVREFRQGRLSLLEAQRLALQIRAPGDRADAMQMLLEVRREKAGASGPRMGRLAYIPQWFSLISARLYGVAAHLGLYKPPGWLWGYYAVFLVTTLMLAYRLFRDGPGPFAWLLFVFLFYVTILMQVVNYGGYWSSGMMGLALTGRYLFPVLLPFYLLIAYGLTGRHSTWWQQVAAGAVAIFFVAGDLPWFLANATSVWYF